MLGDTPTAAPGSSFSLCLNRPALQYRYCLVFTD